MRNRTIFITGIPFNMLVTLITAAMSIYIYIPNLPQMVHDLHTTEHLIRLSITIAVFTSCVVTFFIGPLSDALGRRAPLIISHSIYSLSLLCSAYVDTIEGLMVLRIIQGGAGIVPMVLPFAILSDVYPGKSGQQYYAYCSTAITMSLIAAPLIGGFFGEFYTWRYAFIFLGVLSSLVTLCIYKFVPETLTHNKMYNFQQTFTSYKHLLKNVRFRGIAIMSSFLLSIQVAFFSVGTFYFITVLNLPASHFSLYQGCMMVSNGILSLVSVHAIRIYGRAQTLRLGMGLMLMGMTALVLTCLFIKEPQLLIVASMIFYGAGLGLSWSLFVNDAMAIFPEQSGSTASGLSIIRSFAMGIMMIVASHLYINDLLPVAGLFLITSIICAFIYNRLYRNAT